MPKLYFMLFEICYCYIICKGMRAVSGTRRTSLWVELLSYLGYGIVVGMVYQLWNIPILTLVANLVGLFVLSFNYEGHITSRIFQTFLLYILLAIGETLAMMLTNQTVMKAVESNQMDISAIGLAVGRLIQLLSVVLIEKIVKKQNQRRFSVFQMIIFIVFTAGSFYLEIILFIELSQKRLELVMITNFVILVLNILVIWIYDTLGKRYEELERTNIIQMRSFAYENELKIMKERENSIRLLRHDMKNHCFILKEQLKKNELNKAQEYLDKILKETDVEGVWIQTGNQEIDSFINYKFAEAEKWNISCEIEAKIPEDIYVDEFSMASILGNLLDNAITAAKNAANPEIKMNLSYIKQNLCIMISNTYQGELLYEGEKLVTRKSNKKLHGYGLESVQREVEKYKGSFKVEHSEDMFSVLIMLPVINKVQKEERNNE